MIKYLCYVCRRKKYVHRMEHGDFLPPMLYRLDAGENIQPTTVPMDAVGKVLCSNGPNFSPDGKKFYFVCSFNNVAMSYDYDLEKGLMSNP